MFTRLRAGSLALRPAGSHGLLYETLSGRLGRSVTTYYPAPCYGADRHLPRLAPHSQLERRALSWALGISQITFSILDQRSTWEPSDHPDFPDAQRALFEVDLEFSRPAYTTILINGLAEFYVTSRDSLYHGENVQFWQIRGIVDQTNSGGKATESVSWGSLKVLYK